MADLYCGVEVPDYVAQDCGSEQGGIVAVAFVDSSVDLDSSPENFEDASTWQALIDSSPRLAHIIKNTRGEYAGGSPVEQEGFGTETTRVTGADHEITFEVEWLKDNVTFWNNLNKRKNYKFAFKTASDQLHFVNKPVTVYAKQNVPRDIKAAAFWQVSVKWQDIDNPKIYDAPEGIFE